jgi:hypothetical protein
VIQLGYQLSSEEHPAPDLVGYARRAEEVGFLRGHLRPLTTAHGELIGVLTRKDAERALADTSADRANA